ncbi:hypothetical protein G7068_03345 [Leucobacter viscericola]|uniref:Capsid maturation protease n=1 Tax=Leucobacter viscericola TaxID=2714935 RepID=A0A6G7XCL6_9MICO|nr:hypothetical protein [Leucobacter viscericola]QIK62350.1 hypothetical protein G7068_03345 [Leucobacter viscericola]
MSVAIVEDHRTDLNALRRLAVADLAAVVAAIRGLDPAEAREVLKVAIPDLMDPFMGAASDSAAVLLEELYAQARQRVPTVAPAALLEPARVDSLARWAVAPIVEESLDSSMLSRLTGAATRMIFDSSRTTISEGVTRNPAGGLVEFQRMPRAGCCAFCGMLASRPARMAYRTKSSASEVVGRGSTRTGLDSTGKRLAGGVGSGVKSRGTQAISENYHDDCRCLAVPILHGSTGDAIRASREKYEFMYQQSMTDEDGNRLTTPKGVLAEWRRLHGTS